MSLAISDIQNNIYKHFAGSFALHLLNQLYYSNENVSTIFNDANKLLQNMKNYHEYITSTSLNQGDQQHSTYLIKGLPSIPPFDTVNIMRLIHDPLAPSHQFQTILSKQVSIPCSQVNKLLEFFLQIVDQSTKSHPDKIHSLRRTETCSVAVILRNHFLLEKTQLKMCFSQIPSFALAIDKNSQFLNPKTQLASFPTLKNILFPLHILEKTKTLLNYLQETENTIEKCQLKQINSSNNFLPKKHTFFNNSSKTCVFATNVSPYYNNCSFLDSQSTTLFKGVSTYNKRTYATNNLQKEKRARLESPLEWARA